MYFLNYSHTSVAGQVKKIRCFQSWNSSKLVGRKDISIYDIWEVVSGNGVAYTSRLV